jgi:predicted nucleotidyltransferase
MTQDDDGQFRKITCVMVFGSYLRKASVPGDLDIGVALDPGSFRGASSAESFRG